MRYCGGKRKWSCGAQPGRGPEKADPVNFTQGAKGRDQAVRYTVDPGGGPLAHLRGTGQMPRRGGKPGLEPAPRRMKKGAKQTKQSKTKPQGK